jgi:Glu-tRNA(Gln) amidotransferase subunit E-like FAD-binding protein
MRLEWTRFTREYQQALEEQIMQTLGPALDADVAAREEEELRRLQMEMQMQSNNLPDRELDALMADEIARQEEAEMQAMLEELEREQAQKAQEHQFSDDEYDDVFMELIQQQEEQGRSMAYSQDVEMS